MSTTTFVITTALVLGACTGGDYEVHENDPEMLLATDVIDFDEVVVGNQSEIGIAVENEGRGVLAIEDVSLDAGSSADFTLLGVDVSSVEPGEYGVISARYVPDAVGQDYGTVTLTTNDPTEPVAEIELVGFGVEPDIDVDPETLWFGEVEPGDSATKEVEVTAEGTGTTRITEMVFEENTGVFSYELPEEISIPYDLSAGFSFTFEVTFAPQDDSAYDTNLLVASNDPEDPTVAIRLLGNSDDDPTTNEPPTVEVTEPNWGNYLILGETTTLAGQAIDVEDGPENLACSWYVDGSLLDSGSPDTSGYIAYSTADLPEGDITITLRCYDSQGEKGEDSVDVTVWDHEEELLYTLSGGTSLYDYWSVDDDIYIELNGYAVFSDTNHAQDNHPPLEFEAQVGDTLTLVATDYNYCTQQLDALVLHFGTGESQELNETICRSACEDDVCYDSSYSGPWPNVFLTQDYTIEIPASR